MFETDRSRDWLGQGTAFRKSEIPHLTVFECKDFDEIDEEGNECCTGCHGEHPWVIGVYAPSNNSDARLYIPDMSLGLRAEVCCGRFETVRKLPRSWWLTRYGKKHDWSDAHIAKIVTATPEEYHRVVGEVASYYWNLRNGGRDSSDSSLGRDVSVRRGRSSISSSAGKGQTSFPKCPGCGAKGFADVCSNCGFGGGI